MKLAWRGAMYGRPVEGTVEGGAIDGPFEVVSLVEALVAGGARVGEGPWLGVADLADPRLARCTVAAALDEGTATFEGDEPETEELPPLAEAPYN
ncbi:MAG: hypothetical protein ACRDMZ_23305, partial [Solirubrobacteraceae bacterium]